MTRPLEDIIRAVERVTERHSFVIIEECAARLRGKSDREIMEQSFGDLQEWLSI